MDALFGVPRKNSSGTSYSEAVHGHYFFDDQSMVDEFVSSVSVRRFADQAYHVELAKIRMLHIQ